MPRTFDVTSGPAPDADEEAGTAICERCGREVAGSTLDRWNWCKSCRAMLDRKVRTGQYVVAAAITLPFLIWILVGGTGSVLPTYAWALPLLAAWYLGSRIGRVVVRNYLRAQPGA
ncbi:MAG: hypothetical protein M8866_11300 [marine benthic group bacterium]|jgi:uncharacterized membrane-anchored protein|nr:hypothetical protein [Candidatus Benthicola marisminoris]